MKKREVVVHEVLVRFEVPETEIDVESYGSGTTPTRYRAKKINLAQALAEILADQVREVVPPENLIVEVDGEVVLDETGAAEEGAQK